MKKTLVLLAAAAAMMAVSCKKPADGQDTDANTLTYGGETYKTITLSNGDVWMAEPLRYLPDDVTPSDNPTTSKVCYPLGTAADYTLAEEKTYEEDGTTIKTFKWAVNGGAIVAAKDEATIKEKGYLYSWDIIFDKPVDKDTYNTFEGAQGICPDGWHIPTCAEWKAFCGVVNGDNVKDTKAVFYDKEYDGGRIWNIEQDGFKWGFSGTVFNKAYNTNIVTTKKSTHSEYDKLPALTYVASSTGKVPSSGDATQMYAAMSTFSDPTFDKATQTMPEIGKYPDGRLNVGYANFAGCFVQVRCVKNK